MATAQELRPGDVVKRIWGNGYLESEMRVHHVDDKFVYCDAQKGMKPGAEWDELKSGEFWKFDVRYGVETDEEMRWGVAYGIVLTRIELDGVTVTSDHEGPMTGSKATFHLGEGD